jgi:hypothetical protein
MLQELLTYAIEFVAIGGFGGILAHYITQNCISVPVPQSSSQQDDTGTRGRSDTERNVSQAERSGLAYQGSESPSELSPCLPIWASPCLFLETASAPVAPTATVEPAPAYTLSVEPTPAIVEPQGQSQLEQPCIADPWELPILTSSRRWSIPQPIKPLLALCPAVDSFPVSTLDQTASKSEENDTTRSTDLRKLDSEKLRKLCTQYGIVWRNARGKGKHLTKDMMIVQLEDLAVVA